MPAHRALFLIVLLVCGNACRSALSSVGTHPHHTELEMPANGHLLANGFHAGRTWLFDLAQPLQPQILASFDDVAGFSHPHTFIRLADGHVLATFQYAAEASGAGHKDVHESASKTERATGGLVEMDERGQLIRGASARDRPEPRATFVKGFDGKNCGVPILTSHYWLQTVPDTHALVALDIADPELPRQVSAVSLGDDEEPHWIAVDPSGRRVVLNSAGSKGNRLFIVNFDPASGTLSLDQRFRDPDSARPGISLTGKPWPHGFAGTAAPHGTVFSR